jgi:hypothetical protein
VAVFDHDGTLWSEKPIPIQLDFTLFRMAELAEADPSLKEHQPYKAAAERDYHWLGEAMVKHYRGDDADLHLLMAGVQTAFGGMTVEGFSQEVMTWLQAASHPVLGRPYLSCAFVPMIELLRYLEANGFVTYQAATPTETSPCCASPATPTARRCGCWCCTTTPTANSTTSRVPRMLCSGPANAHGP